MIKISQLSKHIRSFPTYLHMPLLYNMSSSSNFNKKIDYYKVLGISQSATDQQIKLAYFNKAKQQHPDINPAFQQNFKHINQAYRILSDPVLKLQYVRMYRANNNTNDSDINDSDDSNINNSGSDQLNRNYYDNDGNKNRQKDPVRQLFQTNMRYLNIKNKQKYNAHISRQYRTKQQQQTTSNNNSNSNNNSSNSNNNNDDDKLFKYIYRISSILTILLLLQMGIKYYRWNHNDNNTHSTLT